MRLFPFFVFFSIAPLCVSHPDCLLSSLSVLAKVEQGGAEGEVKGPKVLVFTCEMVSIFSGF